jgi:hypothetical protein
MSFDVAIDQNPHFVRVTVTGELEIDQLLSMIHLLGVDSETWSDDRVLVDLRSVRTEFSLLDQYRIGQEAATSLSHMGKIASLVRPERVTRMSEKAAQRSGTNVRVFDDERAATEWLQSALV